MRVVLAFVRHEKTIQISNLDTELDPNMHFFAWLPKVRLIGGFLFSELAHDYGH